MKELVPGAHVAERRALHRLDTTSAPRALALGATRHVSLRSRIEGARVLVTGPLVVSRPVLDVVVPIAPMTAEWDGRSAAPAPDLVIAALPWRYDSIGDVPELPGPLVGPPPAVLPLTFTDRSVTVGPIAGAGGPCLACVHPAFAVHTPRPDPRSAPALAAFAAGASGLFVRAYLAGATNAIAMSLTFDISSPQVEHRLWSCTATCRTAA